MKKLKHLVFTALLATMLIISAVLSVTAASDIVLKSASEASNVKIEGIALANQWVSVKVTYKDTELAYFNGQVAGEDGKYSFTADLSDFSSKLPLDLTISYGSMTETAQIKLEGSSSGGSGGGGGGSTPEPVQPDNDNSKRFTDVEAGSWYENAVYDVVKKGFFSGVSDSRFAPNAPMNRAMFVTVLGRLNGGTLSGSHAFTDVESGSWYDASVGWAFSNNIIKGFSPTIFGPERTITREQMAVIMYNYALFKGMDVNTSVTQSSFTDAAKVSSWAKDAVDWASSTGLIQGDQNKAFNPQHTATRAQVAVILQRFAEKVK